MARSTPILLGLTALLALSVVAAPVRAGEPPAFGAPAVAGAIDLQNAMCPVKGKPVVPGVTATVKGTIVHFCCTGCAAKYSADPAPYAAALRADPAVSKRMDEAGAAQLASAAPPPMAGSDKGVASDKGAAFHDAMRRLWEDHVLWTRLFIVSAVAGLPDKEATTNRLLRNQDDIGNGIKPYYGADAGAKLTVLLKDHITIAADLVETLKANDSTKADAAKKKWFANADEIAAFLSAANPTAWSLEHSKMMMREHLDVTIEEVAARLKGDWDADVAAFEKVHEQALRMADMLSDGIRGQFPEKFQ